jgi:hypothetical protein
MKRKQEFRGMAARIMFENLLFSVISITWLLFLVGLSIIFLTTLSDYAV